MTVIVHSDLEPALRRFKQLSRETLEDYRQHLAFMSKGERRHKAKIRKLSPSRIKARQLHNIEQSKHR